MQRELTYALKSGEHYHSVCTHKTPCAYCVSTDERLAKRLTFIQAIQIRKGMKFFRFGKNWQIVPVCKEPKTVVVRL